MYLLDTHVWLWSMAARRRLAPGILQLLSDDVPVFLSAASVWEIAIKHHAGKLVLDEHPRDFVASRLIRDKIQALPIEVAHAVEVSGLPDHHNDPFDRLMIAQCRVEGLTLITSDPNIRLYDVDILWAE